MLSIEGFKTYMSDERVSLYHKSDRNVPCVTKSRPRRTEQIRPTQ